MDTTRRQVLTGFGAAIAAPALFSRAAASGRPLTVVATTGMIADTARRIATDETDVQALMGPGIDPHSFRQTRTDILAMARADLVLWNGLYLEAQMEEVLFDLSRRISVVAVGEAVPSDLLIAHDDYENRFDPHVWMVPSLWRHAAVRATEALVEQAPERAAIFEENLARFEADLSELGTYTEEVLGSVPENRRVLVTAHDAFNYFGRAYGFEVLGVQGISTESEAGLNRIQELVQVIVERQIGAVFVESSVSDRSVRALVEGAAAQGHEVKIGGELFSDAMGPEGTYEGTYLGMIDHNATVIARSLGGDAPEHGWRGRLSLET